MGIIDASVKPIEQAKGFQGICKHIERCGRICYKSEDRISENSAQKFVDNLISRGHTAMLEHGTVYLRIPFDTDFDYRDHIAKIIGSKYSFTNTNDHKNFWVTTNMRVMVETFPECYKDIMEKYALDEPDINHEKRLTAHFIISRSIANEFVRHRVFSFAQESTRYVNYGKKGLTFIYPEWTKDDENFAAKLEWESIMEAISDYYERLSKYDNLKPQDIRGILPGDLKTELVMTGTMAQWEGFFDLRLREVTGKAHPDAKAIANEWYKIYEKDC